MWRESLLHYRKAGGVAQVRCAVSRQGLWRCQGAHSRPRFGWRPEYQALVEQSSKPRGPQSLMTRAIEGYRQGSVASSTIAKLSGDPNASATKAALAEEGIIPIEVPAVSAPRPKDTGERLTSEELSALMGGAE